MPKLINSVPKYRKHRQSGQAIVTVNGRDHLLGPHGTKTSRLQYDRLIGEWLASGRSSLYGAPQHDLSVVELVVDYLQHLKVYHGAGPASEFHRYKPALKPLRELYGRSPAVEFGPLQLKALRQSFIGLGWSRSYINANVRRIVRMFRWAASDGRVSPAIPQALAMVPGLRKGKTTARETERVLPVDDAIVEATLPHLSPIVAAMVRLQRFTGCRPGEVCRIRPCDVDRTGDVWKAKLTEHKTAHHGRHRTIFIGPQGQDVLRPYLLRASESYCFSPREALAHMRAARAAQRKTPMSCGNRAGTNKRRKPRKQPGDCYTTQSYGRAIVAACDRAFPPPEGMVDQALTDWRREHRWAVNQLRHTAATQIRQAFGLEHAQVTLGHASANITQVYAERDAEKGLEVARQIG